MSCLQYCLSATHWNFVINQIFYPVVLFIFFFIWLAGKHGAEVLFITFRSKFVAILIMLIALNDDYEFGSKSQMLKETWNK